MFGIDSRYIKLALVLSLVIILCIVLYSCSRPTTPQIVSVPSVNTQNVKTALDSAGFKMSNEKAGAIVDKIEKRVASGPADFKATVPNEKKADEVVKQVAKDDKADVVVKEEKPNPTNTEQKDLYYYGIHMEKQAHGYGVYTDLDKDGSYGLHYRNNRLVVEAGKKYKGGSFTGRVAYEIIQTK